MASLTLQSLANPDTTEQRVFDILNDHLRNSTPASETATAINAWTPTEDAEAIESFLWSVWAVFIHIAKQIPHDDAAQDQLVEVITALTALPPRTIQIWDSETRLWTDLPILGPSLRESWNQPTAPAYTSSTPQATTEWINLQAFTARLMSRRDPSLSLFAVWSLRSALEEELKGAERDGEVAAATMWMLYGGQALFEQSNDAVKTEEMERMMKPGPLYAGQGQLCAERWQFWNRRLGELQEEVSEETKGLIQSARERTAGH
ncbi:DUF3632 domain-containing protein [Aspergillus clavatus NRRL 1]|uniref:Uncharacterized protein n=1 Tax=Aspergillus clavatus (strain ATCC 1007 / CBS 513.65 / DSM 816 / NCTC 3887 / NRRL 1 / QM 1276 / 107) TaxID=344612 RepID=A1CAV7_ASPCL|nr:uncharacterized protein ACLA_013090 [Aspergillus clavatus NRRL 1]EAW12875.1 conserved hypothetical protein [Aspergillus clavatus NRRL 1]